MFPAGVGGVQFSDDYGMADRDYERVERISKMARYVPDTLTMSTKSTWEEGWDHAVRISKPDTLAMNTGEMIAPMSYTGTTRNMTYDLRGEAARPVWTASYQDMPYGGGGEVSWAIPPPATGRVDPKTTLFTRVGKQKSRATRQ